MKHKEAFINRFKIACGKDMLTSDETIYLEKHYLFIEEYQSKWDTIKRKVFAKLFRELPDRLFNNEFETIISKGGLVFDRSQFESTIGVIKKLGEAHFVLIEHASPAQPTIMMKYPVSITWDDMMDEGKFSFEIFIRPIRHYFLFGDSGTWGKYVANDLEYPLDILGFSKKSSLLFRDGFVLTPDEKG